MIVSVTVDTASLVLPSMDTVCVAVLTSAAAVDLGSTEEPAAVVTFVVDVSLSLFTNVLLLSVVMIVELVEVSLFSVLRSILSVGVIFVLSDSVLEVSVPLVAVVAPPTDHTTPANKKVLESGLCSVYRNQYQVKIFSNINNARD